MNKPVLRDNGKIVMHRSNGQFAGKPSLGAGICPCCGAINMPVWEHGLPPNKQGKVPANCHRCDSSINEAKFMRQEFNRLICEG